MITSAIGSEEEESLRILSGAIGIEESTIVDGILESEDVYLYT